MKPMQKFLNPQRDTAMTTKTDNYRELEREARTVTDLECRRWREHLQLADAIDALIKERDDWERSFLRSNWERAHLANFNEFLARENERLRQLLDAAWSMPRTKLYK